MNLDVRKVGFGIVALVLVVLAVFAASRSGEDSPTGTPPPAEASQPVGGDVVVAPDETSGDAATIAMPLSEDEIAAAVKKAEVFTQRFTTYRYDQNDATTLAGMRDMLAKREAPDLSGVIPTGDLKARLVAQRFAAESTTKAVRVISLSSNFIAIEVKAEVTERASGATTKRAETYFVTLTDDAGWGVSDIDKSSDATSDEHVH